MAKEHIHVYPYGDVHAHALDGEYCPCFPKEEIHGEFIIVIHNSFDGRELTEPLFWDKIGSGGN